METLPWLKVEGNGNVQRAFAVLIPRSLQASLRSGKVGAGVDGSSGLLLGLALSGRLSAERGVEVESGKAR